MSKKREYYEDDQLDDNPITGCLVGFIGIAILAIIATGIWLLLK